MAGSEEDTTSKKVAIVTEDADSSYMTFALNLLEHMESTEGKLAFEIMEEEKAYRDMEARKVIAIIEIPEGAIDNIMVCLDAKINIVFPGNKDISSVYLTELTKAGARLLTTGQAGTLTTGHSFLQFCGMSAVGSYTEIDNINFSYVLSRGSLFKDNEEDFSGAENYLAFYLSTGLLILFLLISVGFIPALALDSAQLTRIKATRGISPFTTYSIRVITYTLIMLLFNMLVLFAGSKIYPYVSGEKSKIHFTLPVFLFFLVLAFFLSVYSNTILYGMADTSKAILALFLVGVLLSFCSGSILPLAFFPEGFRNVGKHLPTYDIQHNISCFLQGKTSFAYKQTLLWSAGLILFSLLLVLRKKKKDMH